MSKTIKITFQEYAKIIKSKNDFKKLRGRNPNYIIVQNKYRTYEPDYVDAINRVNAFYRRKSRYPKTINIIIDNPPKNKPSKPTVYLSDKSDFLKSIAKAIGGKFNTFTEFYNLVHNEIYAHYNNDIYPQGQAITRLQKNLPLNCSDFSQLGYKVANELGYVVRFVHAKCKVSGGHIYLQVKGKELGDKWVNADLAAAASDNSNYPLGKVWCSDGKIVSYNDPWLILDDGKT
jgi:hypothetical protein